MYNDKDERGNRIRRVRRNVKHLRMLFDELEQLHETIAARLSDTAKGLRDGSVNPYRAANRLDEVVRQITSKG